MHRPAHMRRAFSFRTLQSENQWLFWNDFDRAFFFSFSDNTAGIATKRSGFRRRLQEIYLLPVVIEDNGYPPKSSTGTLTIRVCGCESDGSLLSCSAEAIFLPVGLSTGALIAILLCIVILLGELMSSWFWFNINGAKNGMKKCGIFFKCWSHNHHYSYSRAAVRAGVSPIGVI